MIFVTGIVSFILLYIMSEIPSVKSYVSGLWAVSVISVLNQGSFYDRIMAFILRLIIRNVDRKVPKGLPNLSPYEKVSERVYRISGQNPGPHTLQGTNTYLVGTGPNKVLIDTGEDSTSAKYTSLLFDSVFPLSATKCISSILLTHGHGDHLGGVPKIIDECKTRKLPIPKIYKCNIDGGNYPASGFDCINIADGDVFRPDDETTINAIYSPGHTDDHVAFHLEEDNALFSGDCVLGCGTTVFDDLFDYMKSLVNLRSKMIIKGDGKEITNIYPGHGPVIRDKALQKVDEYISHRKSREIQILEVLDKNPTYWRSSWELVNLVYGPLNFVVKISALRNVTHHLEKLKKEGTLETKFPALWRRKQSKYSSREFDSIFDRNDLSKTHKMVCDGEMCQLVPR